MLVGNWLSALNGARDLGPQSARVLRFLGREPQLAAYASAREIAERAGVNTSTVVRTAQQLGYEGWPALRHQLRSHYIASMASGEVTVPSAGPADADGAAAMLRQDAANLQTLITDDTIAAIRVMAAAIDASRRTLVIGSGLAETPAGVLGHLGAVMGHDVRVASGSATALSAQVSLLGEGDCLLMVNVWRLLRVLPPLAELARERGATVCVITDLHASPLAAIADHVVVAPIESGRPTPSLTAMVAVIQAVVAALPVTPEAVRAVGRVEQLWQRLGLMDEDV
ncbi:MurR/RpiR family transcriptional regulator (plasmid) [Streptomyces sp. HUAS 31]|uniref:MurR/RpiR family transcriptional regulator n=1 Tax=Streptomyces TaxID=1883 RepID=UPI0023068505|nr:MurR/RpiR family transcriptional regulator [Streptomyces sp. HUAS 31]WCE02496.1 MurR/RpiR family transcriptional regulator [Streptomyces sp. HUAS 31]